jgi:hypothetical protein
MKAIYMFVLEKTPFQGSGGWIDPFPEEGKYIEGPNIKG